VHLLHGVRVGQDRGVLRAVEQVLAAGGSAISISCPRWALTPQTVARLRGAEFESAGHKTVVWHNLLGERADSTAGRRWRPGKRGVVGARRRCSPPVRDAGYRRR